MFVFLVLSMLYPNDTLPGFAMATKTCPAAKRYWRPLNEKPSCVEYFLSFKIIFADTICIIQSKNNHLTPSLRMRSAG